MNTLVSERVAILGVINPQDGATTARSTGWVDASGFHRLVGVVLGGAITGTLDAKIEQASASDGTGVKDVTGRAITQVADTDDNVQALINIRADQLDFNNGFTYVRLTITPTGGTTNLLSGLLLGADPRHGVASGHNADSVAEVV